MRCERKLWLSIHRSDLSDSVSNSRKRAIETGNRVGSFARKQFSGILVEAESADRVVEESNLAIESRATIFEAGLIADGVYVRVDIMEPGTRGWIITEVKSATRRKSNHLADVSIQRYVAELAGVDIEEIRLMYLNPEAAWPVDQLFITEDVTDESAEYVEGVGEIVESLSSVVELEGEPEVLIGNHCKKPHLCPFVSWCWRDVPKPSIFDIPNLPGELKKRLVAEGKLHPGQLPEDKTIPPVSIRHRDLYLSNEPRIDWSGIDAMFRLLEPPLSFLDFETDAPAIPRIPGTRPYEAVPFQYSLHIAERIDDLEITEPKDLYRHVDFLHVDPTDPRPELAESLVRDLGREGTIIAYSAGFERGVVSKLAELYPDKRKALLDLLPRFWDLLELLRRHYDHPAFLGSKSLKRVLPVLVPELSYDGLDVGNGIEAQATWNELLETSDKEVADRAKRGLIEYCEQDTWAMVAIASRLCRDLASSTR